MSWHNDEYETFVQKAKLSFYDLVFEFAEPIVAIEIMTIIKENRDKILGLMEKEVNEHLYIIDVKIMDVTEKWLDKNCKKLLADYMNNYMLNKLPGIIKEITREIVEKQMDKKC
jgi:hypothetical protein